MWRSRPRPSSGKGPAGTPGAALIWLELTTGLVHRWNPVSGDDAPVGSTVPVGAAVPRSGGGPVAATAEGFADQGRRPLPSPVLAAGERCNDGKCDPQGRFWAGTATPGRPGAATLYLLDHDHTITSVITDVTVSNGLGWSPDGSLLFYVDTTAGRTSALSTRPAAPEGGEPSSRSARAGRMA